MLPGKPRPKLSPEEELELIRRWQRHRDQQAALRLMAAHRGWVRAEVEHFLGCGVPEKDLMQEAWEGFFEAVDRYDPAKAKGARLEIYARPRVRYRLIEACATELELSDDGRRAFKTALDAWEELAQELDRLPTRAEVVERATSRLLKQERHHNAESEEQYDSPERKSRWNEPRARAAVEEVLDALERKKLPLWEEWEEDEGEEVGVMVPSPMPGPEELLINRELIREWCRSACRVLGEAQGQKWTAVWVLKELEEAKEKEVVDWLKASNCPAHGFWPDICKAYRLDGCIPGSWQEIQVLFAVPPPTLKEGNLRQWYWRATERLIQAGVLRP